MISSYNTTENAMNEYNEHLVFIYLNNTSVFFYKREQMFACQEKFKNFF